MKLKKKRVVELLEQLEQIENEAKDIDACIKTAKNKVSAEIALGNWGFR